jgi:hypothetical protein
VHPKSDENIATAAPALLVIWKMHLKFLQIEWVVLKAK